MLPHARTIVLQVLKDPRIFVFVAQFAYVAVGIREGFSITWLEFLLAIAGSIGAELLFTYARTRKWALPLSALPTAGGIGMYFRSSIPLVFVLCGIIAIGSKFVFRRPGGGHVFNPSNFAITSLAFLLPSVVTIEFTQWGSSLTVYCLIAIVCLSIAWYADVLEVSLSFLVSYILLFLLLLPHLPDVFAPHHYGILGPTLVVFATLMITDPKTVPKTRLGRILHGFSVVALFFLFELWGIRYSLFLALAVSMILNVASQLLVRFFSRRGRIFRPDIAFAFALVTTVFCVSFVSEVLPHPPLFSVFDISSDFLLRGIESPSVLQCSAKEAFVQSPQSFGANITTYGGAWADYNADGYEDLYVSNVSGDVSRLYRNNGNGTFTDVTQAAGLPLEHTESALWMDYDNDGRPDLFVTYPTLASDPLFGDKDAGERSYLALRVYHNNGDGTFTDVTQQLGLGSFVLPGSYGAGLSAGDYNNDGYLDLTLATYGYTIYTSQVNTAQIKSFLDPFFGRSYEHICDASAENTFLDTVDFWNTASQSDIAQARAALAQGACIIIDQRLDLLSRGRALPVAIPISNSVIDFHFDVPGSVYVFENEEGKRFVKHSDITALVNSVVSAYRDATMRQGDLGQDGVSGHFFQPISFDYNGDGRTDIFVTSDLGDPLLLRNDGNFKFSVQTAPAGLDYAGTSMGVDIADYRHTGAISLVTTHTGGSVLYQETGTSTFALETDTLDQLGIGWGVSFLDYNLDGWDDLFVANGDIERTAGIPIAAFDRTLFRSDKLYRNDGSGNLVDVTWSDLCPTIQSGKAVAIADVMNDGDPDIFTGNISVPNAPGMERNILYMDMVHGPSWIEIDLRGTTSNSFGIGATVSVVKGSLKQERSVLAGNSFNSQDSSRLLFGLGSPHTPVDINVQWPSGKKSVLNNVLPDRILTIREP